MKSFMLSLFALLLCELALAQSPETAPLPNKFTGLREGLVVDHFPSPVLASQDPDEPGIYFWKHNTSVFSPKENITVLEGGAYIFYNQQWNLRVTFSAKEFSKFFKIPKGILKAGQNYTFVDNWRRDQNLRGGWAMWYIIGETASGEKVYGIGKLDTVGEEY